jgi:hypothetical protein
MIDSVALKIVNAPIVPPTGVVSLIGRPSAEICPVLDVVNGVVSEFNVIVATSAVDPYTCVVDDAEVWNSRIGAVVPETVWLANSFASAFLTVVP